MPPRVTERLLLLFLTSLGVAWPSLPGNAQLSDLLFIPLVIALAVAGARPSFKARDGAVLAYLAGAVLSLAASTQPASGLIELGRECYLVAIYMAIAAAVRQGRIRTIAAGLALSGGMLAALGLVFEVARAVRPFDAPTMGSVMALPYIGSMLRLRALTASESMLACVLTMSAPFAIAKWADSRRASGARGWMMTARAMVVAAPLTFSHSVAGFAVAIVIASWPLLQPTPRLQRAAATAAIIAVIGFNLAATISVRSINTGRTELADPTPYHYGVGGGDIAIGGATVDYQVMSYLRLKQLAIETWLANPVFGIGLDRFHEVTRQAWEQGRLTAPYQEVDPHSSLPGRLAEAGLVGGVTLLLLWIVFTRVGMGLLTGPEPTTWAARAAVAGLAGILVNSVNADVMNFRFVWVGLGVVAGLADLRER